MALRIVLVGLVAALGLELPSGSDLAKWGVAARQWVGAGADGAAVVEASPLEIPSGRDDPAFGAVVDAMARDFADDLARVDADRPVDVRVAAPDAGPGLADEVEPSTVPEPAEAPATSPVDRVRSALDLTRQALGAWASLIQAAPVGASADPAR